MTKPLTIVLYSKGTNGYEALFHSKSLETVNVNLIPEQVATATPKLLIAFSEVIIKVYCSEVQLELFFPVLQFLLSQSLPNLREFDFCATGNIDRINTNRDALEEQFREFNLTVKANDGPCIDVELSPHFPKGTFCKVMLSFYNRYVRLLCVYRFFAEMAAFPLANLDTALLEMVITKLDHKSYFRIQQTCRRMKGFIRRNKNISIHLDGYYEAYADEEIYCYKGHRSSIGSIVNHTAIDVDTLYGTRLSRLKVLDGNDLAHICDCLKKYRLTFAGVYGTWVKWTNEQILTILKMTKPLWFVLNSKGSNLYEALLQSKSLMRVIITLNPEQVATVIPKLLLAFPEVIINVSRNETQFELLRTVLRILRSQPLPNLRKFYFYTNGRPGRINTNPDDLEKEFRGFNLTVTTSALGYINAAVEMPPHFSEGSTCKVELAHGGYAHLYCVVEHVSD